jgi:hypothetical protein
MSEMLNYILDEIFDLKKINLPTWLDETIENKTAIINSYAWTADRCRRIRLCKLNIKEKFTAETLVIYPEYCYETPIFGTEYIRIGTKKYFGAIDFHPVRNDTEYEQHYILNYLGEFPNRDQENSKFYDLTKYFSNKFWTSKRDYDFYEEYIEITKKYLKQYKLCLDETDEGPVDKQFHQDYDTHMSANDPAHGILKAYYSEQFATDYIHTFLFNLNG